MLVQIGNLPIGMIERRVRVGITQPQVRAARFAGRAADKSAGGKDHDAERPEVGHPDVPAGSLISLPVSFATRNRLIPIKERKTGPATV